LYEYDDDDDDDNPVQYEVVHGTDRSWVIQRFGWSSCIVLTSGSWTKPCDANLDCL